MRIILGLVLFGLSGHLAGTTSAAGQRATARPLEPDSRIEREIERSQEHAYRIRVEAGQFMQVVIEGKRIALALALTAPDGPNTAAVAIPRVPSGAREEVSILADATRDYELSVRALDANPPSGSYELRFELRAPTAADRQRLTALALLREARPMVDGGAAADRAIEKLEQALPLWRDLQDRYWEAETLELIGLAHFRASRAARAIEHYEQASALYRAIGRPTAEARLLTNLNGAHNALSQYTRGIEYGNRALALARESNERRSEGVALNMLANSYNFISRYDTAIDHLDRAGVIARESNDRVFESVILNTLGSTYRSVNRYEQAIEAYERALSINREEKDRLNESLAVANLAIVYHILGRYEKAIEYHNQALAIHRERKNRNGEGIVLNNLGIAYKDLKRYTEAIEALERALAINREVKRRVGEGNTLTNLGNAYAGLKQYDKALEYYEQSLPIIREVKNREYEGSILNTIGGIHHNLGDHEKSIEYSEQALAIAREVKVPAEEAAALRNLARTERDRGNLSRARALIDDNLRIIESLRGNIFNQSLRASFFASEHDSHQLQVDLLMRLHQANPGQGFDARALEAAERARARSLIELLTEAGAAIRTGVDPSLVERERSLASEINAKAQTQLQLLRAPQANEQAAALGQEITRLEDEYEQVQSRIRQVSPRYAAMTQPEPLTADQIQQQVTDAGTLLLQYALGDDRSYVWAVTDTSISSHELPKREEIEAAAREVVEALTARSAGVAGETASERRRRVADADARLPHAAGRLSRMVLGPVASQLGHNRLLVVPDGALQYVPFAMLPVPVDAASNSRSNSAAVPLVAHHEIVSLPSASTIAVMRKELASRPPADRAVAVIADPVFSPTDPRIKGVATSPKLERPTSTRADDESRILAHLAVDSSAAATSLVAPRLPFTRQEADRILAAAARAATFKAVDFDASKATVTSGALRDYRYVHFATHGYVHSERPSLSALVLSMVDRKGGPQDGFLRAHETYNLSLRAELVVLSACQTGLGTEIKGEGLIGLTRGFMYAGAARVVVSLWNVSDKATAELMARFYERMLTDGQRPAAALRAAQIDMWRQKQWESPFYWAAFTLQGEWK